MLFFNVALYVRSYRSNLVQKRLGGTYANG